MYAKFCTDLIISKIFRNYWGIIISDRDEIFVNQTS